MRQDYFMALALVALFPLGLATPVNLEARATLSSSKLFKPDGTKYSGSGTPPPMPTGTVPPPPPGVSSSKAIEARATDDAALSSEKPTGSLIPHAPSGSGSILPPPSGPPKSIAARAASSTIEAAKPSVTGMPPPMKHTNGTDEFVGNGDTVNGTDHVGGHHNSVDAAFAGHGDAAAGNGTHHHDAARNGTHHGSNATSTTATNEAEKETNTKDLTSSTTTSSTSAAGSLGVAGSVVFGLVAMVGATFL